MNNEYVRDSRSNAIQEVNLKSLVEHRARRQILKAKDDRIKNLEVEMDNLKSLVMTLIKEKENNE